MIRHGCVHNTCSCFQDGCRQEFQFVPVQLGSAPSVQEARTYKVELHASRPCSIVSFCDALWLGWYQAAVAASSRALRASIMATSAAARADSESVRRVVGNFRDGKCLSLSPEHSARWWGKGKSPVDIVFNTLPRCKLSILGLRHTLRREKDVVELDVGGREREREGGGGG